MKQEVTICDNCKTQKEQSNKWWIGYRLKGSTGVIVVEWDNDLWEAGRISQETISHDEPVHLCGSHCVSNWISQTIL